MKAFLSFGLSRRLGRAGRPLPADTAARRRKRQKDHSIGHQEQLECRRALAVTGFNVNGPSLLYANDGDFLENGLLDGRSWMTVVSDGGDDIYVQQTSPADPGQAEYLPSLIYASNASFLNFGEFKDVNSYTDLYATNATLTRNRAELGGVAEDSDGYPFNDPGTPQLAYSDRSFETTFVLPTDDVDEFELITGRVTNGVGGVWSFTNTPGRNGHNFSSSAFTPIGVPTGPNPRSAVIVSSRDGVSASSTGDTDAIFIVTWDSNSLAPGGMSTLSPPVLQSITYDLDDDDGGLGFTLITAPPTEASSPFDPTYRLPLPASVPANQANYEIVPGTLSGFIDITQYGVRYEFTTISQFPIDDPLNVDGLDANVVRDADGAPVLNPAGQGLRESTLVFRRVPPSGLVLPWRQAGLFHTNGPDDFDGNDARFMTGILTYAEDLNGAGEIFYRPTIELKFYAVDGDADDDLEPDVEPFEDVLVEGETLYEQEVGRVTIDAEYAIFNQPTQFVGGNFTFYDGHDFSRNLTVDLLAPGATISIESPILFNPAGGVDAQGNPTTDPQSDDSPSGHFIDLRASNTILEAQMWSGTSFNLRDSFAGEAKAEQLFVNAANAARTYDIRVKDDPLTDSVRRSEVFVSTTGSLAGLLPTAPGILPENSESLFVLSNTGDVFVEGTIAADYQSYILQSPIEKADDGDIYGIANRAPYYFTTQSRISEAITGKLRGISLAVTLGNDTPTVYDDTQNGGSSAYNVVTLQTQVDSIRVQASDRAGNPIQTPFPYDLWLLEDDKLRVDAVAASSLPLAIYSKDDLSWNATLLSAGDVTAAALEGDLDLNAPLHTTFGSISLAADRLSVRNSVRVLDTFNDNASLYVNDIVLEARDGDLLLTGPISAVNTIELLQSGEGTISGDSRVVAERVLVRAEGAVTIKTETAELTGSAASISVDESDDIFVNEFSVSDGYISLVANGYDPLVPEVDEFGFPTVNDDGTPTGNVVSAPALRAVLPDTRTLVASAPRGSIDIRLTNADPITVGDASMIANRTAVSMVAGGSVFIESLGGNIDVFDAPYAASGAVKVRAATTDDLGGVYANRTPGTFPDTLTAANVGSLVVDGIQMRVREVVLLKNQGNGRENGVYQVVSPGSQTTRWVLRRVASLDQTFEIPEYFRVTVNEGSQSGQAFVLKSYADELGTTPRAVTPVLNNYDALEVRAVSTAELQAEYAFDPISESWTLTSSSDAAIPLFDGVSLELGDLVLVRMGSRNLAGEATRASNGLYTVSNVGSNLSPWVLTEVKGLDGKAITEGIFKASEGTLRAKLTGGAFKLYFDSLGWSDMEIEEDVVTTKIGSRDVNDRVRFVTSTNLGTNNSVGSLGKMITLYNVNGYVNEPDLEIDPDGVVIPQIQSFAFAPNIGGTIRLTQELPQLTRTIAIDSALSTGTAVPVVVDGSRIRTNRDWSAVEGAEPVDGFEFTQDASGSRFVGLYVGGFTRGSAIKMTDADDVLVKDVRLGVVLGGTNAAVPTQQRLANRVGLEVGGNAGGLNTVLNSSVFGSTVSGIRLTDDGQLRVVGTQVGASGYENTTGVETTDGRMFFGVLPANVSLRRISTKVVDTVSFSVPGSLQALTSIYVGLGISSPGIAPTGDAIAAKVASISDPDPAGRVTIVIADGTVTQLAGESMSVGFGAFTQLEAGSDQVPMPVGVSLDEIFLGQTISGTGIPGGATIVNADSTTLWLSSPATITSDPGTNVAVVLGTPGRNTVSQNSRGVVIRGGESTFIGTDVSNSVFDGILIAPVAGRAADTYVTIGGSGGRVGLGGRATDKDLAFAGNAIFGNGSAGIRVGAAAVAQNVVIKGNRLGVTRDGSLNLNKAGNIVAPAAFYGPVSGTYVEDLAQLSFTKLNASTRTVLVTSATAHGLRQGDPVRLRFAVGTDAVFSVTRVDSAKQFTVTLTSAQFSSLVGTGNVSRVRFRVTLAENHFLKTNHLLWLEFVNRNGLPGSVQDARKVTRIDGTQNAFLVDGVAGVPTGGNVYVNRYGRQSGGSPVQYAYQLRRTDQIDYEGNVHGLASTVVAAPTGGVVSTPNPVVSPNPSVSQGPVVRPPVRR